MSNVLLHDLTIEICDLSSDIHEGALQVFEQGATISRMDALHAKLAELEEKAAFALVVLDERNRSVVAPSLEMAVETYDELLEQVLPA
jgi:uncharacterized coiled-coil protein SlyX